MMPGTRTQRTPTYRLHKPSGQAVVTLGDRDHYLGPHGTQESRERYDRLIAEWLAHGRRLPHQTRDLTVVELILAYWQHAKGYYRKNGSPTDELHGIRAAMRPLKKLYRSLSASEFGPLKLKTVRQTMIGAGYSRKYINDNLNRIKRMFRWAVENELVPPSVFHGLQAVGGLKRGRSEARETEPVRPVPQEHIAAALPHLSRQVAAMVNLQLATGMRPGEVAITRTIDLDTTGKLWVYRPSTHKTEHHDKRREIYLGPRAQEILRPFLRSDLEAYLFSPAEAERERSEQRRRNRKTPVTPSQARRRPKRNRKRAPRDRYTVDSYRRAIWRACDLADAKARGGGPPFVCELCGRSYGGLGHLKQHARQRHGETVTRKLEGERVIPRWFPNQLRHNFATRMRKEFGLEVTRVLLGHTSVATSEIYAERDSQLAASIVAKIG